MAPRGAGSAIEEFRTAGVIGTLCLATDLGMGFPFEHGLHTTLIAMRLVDQLGVDRQTAVQTYYGSLLAHAGCATEVYLAAEVFGGSLTEHRIDSGIASPAARLRGPRPSQRSVR